MQRTYAHPPISPKHDVPWVLYVSKGPSVWRQSQPRHRGIDHAYDRQTCSEIDLRAEQAAMLRGARSHPVGWQNNFEPALRDGNACRASRRPVDFTAENLTLAGSALATDLQRNHGPCASTTARYGP